MTKMYRLITALVLVLVLASAVPASAQGVVSLTIDELTMEGRIAHLADSYDATVTRSGWSAARVCDGFRETYRKIGRSDDAIFAE